MTNVYYAVVNSTSCIKKEERRKITFHIKSRFVDNFISENKVHVCKHFIYTMYFYILLKRGKVNLTDVYNASVNYDIPNTHKNNLHMVLYRPISNLIFPVLLYFPLLSVFFSFIIRLFLFLSFRFCVYWSRLFANCLKIGEVTLINPFYIGPYEGYFYVCLGCHILHKNISLFKITCLNRECSDCGSKQS
jgi:hypothetical protein